MRIHMSQSSRDILAQHEDFVIEKRGLVELKVRVFQVENEICILFVFQRSYMLIVSFN